MANNRLDQVISRIVASVREAVIAEGVTFEEYRAGVAYLQKVADAGEMYLFADVWLNATIHKAINNAASPGVSESDMEGPYFLEDAPVVQDGKLKILSGIPNAEPMLVKGVVQDVQGKPVDHVEVDIWCSTPDGRYGGIDEGVPADHYRGKLFTDSKGEFAVEATVPVAYRIPDTGPTGALLERMGRHSWRPAHVHLKLRHPDFDELITQLYFEEDRYLHEDCCEGVVPAKNIFGDTRQDGMRLLESTFVIDAVKTAKAA